MLPTRWPGTIVKSVSGEEWEGASSVAAVASPPDLGLFELQAPAAKATAAISRHWVRADFLIICPFGIERTFAGDLRVGLSATI